MTFLQRYKTYIWVVASVGIIANLADAMTTFIALTYTALQEANPLMAILYEFPWMGYPLKIIVGTWIFLPLPYCPAYNNLKSKNKINLWLILIGWFFAIFLFTKVAVDNFVLTFF